MASTRLPDERSSLVPMARVTPTLAALLLAAFGLVFVWGVVVGVQHHGPNWRGGGHDGDFYSELIQKVRSGASYYAVAPEELRRWHFPLRPVFTTRPPLLTVAMAQLPDEGARHLSILAFAGCAWLAWAWRLWPAYRNPIRRAWALTFLSSGLALALADTSYLFHEVWVGVLISLAIAIRGPRLWIVSVALGLVAALMRELSFPFLGAMALFAWRDGKRGEAAAWIGALAVAAFALVRHALAVAAATPAGGPASASWIAFGAYPFILHMAQLNLVLLQAPLWVAAFVLPPALLGLLFWRGGGGGRGARAAFVVWGYALGFCVFGRPDNDYWGLIIAPLWPLGLIEADRAVVGLVDRVRGSLGRKLLVREA